MVLHCIYYFIKVMVRVMNRGYDFPYEHYIQAKWFVAYTEMNLSINRFS